MARQKWAVWSWDERTRTWMAVDEGSQQDMEAALDQKRAAAARHMPSAKFTMSPAGQPPQFAAGLEESPEPARQGITAEEVLDIAAGAVAGWAEGWTADDGHTPQRRVRFAGGGDGYVDLLVEGARHTGEPDRMFRVTLTAAELEHWS